MPESKDKKPKIGRPPKHSAYSLIVKSGSLPENRRHVRRYLSRVRTGLIEDLAGTEENLTTAQEVLISRIVSKLGICRVIEEHIAENTVIEGSELAPILKQNYLAYSNSIRLDLQALGIERKQIEPSITLAEVVKEFEESKKVSRWDTIKKDNHND